MIEKVMIKNKGNQMGKATLKFFYSIYRPPHNGDLLIQAALIICGLFICNFEYMQLKNCLFPGTYPLIYGIPRYFYMQIHYMRAYFWSPYLLYIMRSASTWVRKFRKWNLKVRAKTLRRRVCGGVGMLIEPYSMVFSDLKSLKQFWYGSSASSSRNWHFM